MDEDLSNDTPAVSIEDLPVDERRKLPYDHPLLDDLANRVSDQIGIPGVVTALKNAGEKSQSGAVSPKGAQGVMQFIPDTAKRYGLNDPTDPVEAIQAAGRYVADMSQKLGTKDPALLAAGYNAGENRKDIRAGKIPLIPETQNYVKRVKGWYASRGDPGDGGVDPADLPSAGGIDPADLPSGDSALVTQDDILRKYASPKGPQVNSTSTEASPVRKIWNPVGKDFEYRVPQSVANFLAGVDKGVSDPVIGATQRLRELANRGSQALIDKPVFDLGQSYRDVKTRNAYDDPLVKSGMGAAGYMTGSGIDAALASTLTGGAAAPTLLGSAASGALSGYTMPTASPEEANTNAEVGAVLGPLSTLAMRGVSKLAHTAPAQAVLDPIRDAANTAAGAVGKIPLVGKFLQAATVKPSLASGMTEPQREAIGAAFKHDIPIYSKQVTDPGFELPEVLRARQQGAFDKALAGTVGQPNATDLNSAWQAAHADLSKRYSKLLDGKQIPLDFQHLADVSGLIAQNAAREPRFAANKEVQDTLERAFKAAEAGTPMSGADYQQALREYSGLATKLFHGTPENPSDPYSAKLVLRLMSSLEDQAGQALGPKDMREFKTLNNLWRNKAQLESVVPKNVTGNADPRALQRALASKRKDEFLYGEGDQTLPNLANLGAFMDLSKSPKPGLWTTVKGVGKTVLPYLGAGGVEGAVSAGLQKGDTPYDLASEGAKMAAVGIPAGLLFNAYRKQAAGQQLTAAEFAALRGAMPAVVHGMTAPGALTRFGLAEHAAKGEAE